MAEATATVTAGALLRRFVRNYLEQAKFQGYDIRYHESKGFLESVFIIKGPEDDLRKVYAVLEEHCSE